MSGTRNPVLFIRPDTPDHRTEHERHCKTGGSHKHANNAHDESAVGTNERREYSSSDHQERKLQENPANPPRELTVIGH